MEKDNKPIGLAQTDKFIIVLFPVVATTAVWLAGTPTEAAATLSALPLTETLTVCTLAGIPTRKRGSMLGDVKASVYDASVRFRSTLLQITSIKPLIRR